VIDKFDLPKSFLARLIRVAVADDNGGAEGVREVRDLLRLPFLTGLGQVFKARTGEAVRVACQQPFFPAGKPGRQGSGSAWADEDIRF